MSTFIDQIPGDEDQPGAGAKPRLALWVTFALFVIVVYFTFLR